MAKKEITTKYVPSYRVIAVRSIVPIARPLPTHFIKVDQALESRPGPWKHGMFMALYYNQPGEDWDVEIGVTVPDNCDEAIPMKNGATLAVRDFPPIDTAATTVHKGAYDTLGQSYEALTAWIAANGYQVARPVREIYLNSPADTPPKDLLTEIQFPVMKV